MNTIDYKYFGLGYKFYDALGYQAIEVPWRVTTDILDITKPPGVDRKDFIIAGTDKALLASGEQGFLYLANKGMLPDGMYQTVTPCFRNESYDRYHSKQFMKLELIRLFSKHEANELIDARLVQPEVETMARQAKEFFKSLAGKYANMIKTVIVTGEHDPIAMSCTEQIDVVMDFDGREIELGSYGARQTTFAAWIYGTGLAEPRFSRTLAEALAS